MAPARAPATDSRGSGPGFRWRKRIALLPPPILGALTPVFGGGNDLPCSRHRFSGFWPRFSVAETNWCWWVLAGQGGEDVGHGGGDRSQVGAAAGAAHVEVTQNGQVVAVADDHHIAVDGESASVAHDAIADR